MATLLGIILRGHVLTQVYENLMVDWFISGYPYLFVPLHALVIDGSLRSLLW